jgi:hypothetical protein
MKQNSNWHYCHIKHVHIHLYCSITDRLRNTLRKDREREQLALLVTQCNFQGQHTYNCIILFIAIFGKERTSNEREKKKRKKIGDFPGWSFVFFLTGFNADVWVCHDHIYELFFFFYIMQHTKLKKEKKGNRMKNRRSKEKKRI